jgi:hypothetical protein
MLSGTRSGAWPGCQSYGQVNGSRHTRDGSAVFVLAELDLTSLLGRIGLVRLQGELVKQFGIFRLVGSWDRLLVLLEDIGHWIIQSCVSHMPTSLVVSG